MKDKEIGKVISVVNYKGGVVKSAVVSNLGALLALAGNRVLLTFIVRNYPTSKMVDG